MRNVLKQAEIGQKAITPAKDLTQAELQQFFEIFQTHTNVPDAVFDLVGKAFYMGYAAGSKEKRCRK